VSTEAVEPAGSGAIPDLATLLDQLAGTPAAPPEDPVPAAAVAVPEPPGPADKPEPLFGDLDAFVRGYLAPVVERRVVQGASAGVAWCPQWWRHPEAISRLYAIWRAWETLRVADPDTGMSSWWRDHFDPHFAVLTAENGPLGKCSPDRGHVATVALPIEPAPPEVLAQLPDVDQPPGP
jgi:hypothetical protein